MKKVVAEHFQQEYMQHTKNKTFIILILIVSTLFLSVPLVLFSKYSKEKQKRLNIKDTKPEEVIVDQEELIYVYPSPDSSPNNSKQEVQLEVKATPLKTQTNYQNKYKNDDYEEDDD